MLAKRGLVVVISDLLDEPARVIDGLRHFRQRGTDVIVFHLLDREELRFTFDDAARFRDVETAAEVFADPAAVRGRAISSGSSSSSPPTAASSAAPASTTTCSTRRSRSTWR